MGNITKARGQIYIQAGKQAAKKAEATNKALAMNELYEELETPEGERKIFRIAKARDKASRISDKERTWCDFKGPGYDHRKMEGLF